MKSGDAVYVQIIHTTLIPGIFKRTGDATVIVYSNCTKDAIESNHLLALRMHELIATKKEFMIATNATNNEEGVILNWNAVCDKSTLRDDQYEVGIYNKDRKKGVFHITVDIEGNCEIPAWLN